MKRSTGTVFLTLVIAVAGCGGGGSGDGKSLRANVEAYSAAYLGNQPEKAIALMTARCKQRMNLAGMKELTATAEKIYGTAKLISYAAELNEKQARVTYRYSDPAIDQVSEPWAKEAGQWLQDDC